MEICHESCDKHCDCFGRRTAQAHSYIINIDRIVLDINIYIDIITLKGAPQKLVDLVADLHEGSYCALQTMKPLHDARSGWKGIRSRCEGRAPFTTRFIRASCDLVVSR